MSNHKELGLGFVISFIANAAIPLQNPAHANSWADFDFTGIAIAELYPENDPSADQRPGHSRS